MKQPFVGDLKRNTEFLEPNKWTVSQACNSVKNHYEGLYQHLAATYGFISTGDNLSSNTALTKMFIGLEKKHTASSNLLNIQTVLEVICKLQGTFTAVFKGGMFNYRGLNSR